MATAQRPIHSSNASSAQDPSSINRNSSIRKQTYALFFPFSSRSSTSDFIGAKMNGASRVEGEEHMRKDVILDHRNQKAHRRESFLSSTSIHRHLGALSLSDRTPSRISIKQDDVM